MLTFNEVWRRAVEIISQKVTPVSLDVWIKAINPVDFNGEKAVLSVPSSFHRDIVKAKYNDLIKQALYEVLGFDAELEILIDSEAPKKVKTEVEEPAINPEKVISSLPADDEYNFDNFIVGSSNRFAHAACIAVAASPAKAYNPLFIHGGSGLGKTHLLYAIMNSIKHEHPEYKILYIKGEHFTNELIEAVRTSNTNEFKNKYRTVDVLLVDDIQFIGGKESTQEEFFHTFNTLYEAKKQIVLTSDRPPKEIQLLEDRLRSRFEWGLIADIQPPDFELRMAIIRKKAEMLNLNLPDDVVEFLANKLKNNIRQLEGALKKILAFHLINLTPPSISVAQSAVRDVLNENEPVTVTIDRIITDVARYYNISPEDIKSKKRTAEVTMARQVSMYIIREITQMSLPNIGDEFSGRDHSTVHHAISKIEETIKTNSSFKNTIQDLIKHIKEK